MASLTDAAGDPAALVAAVAAAGERLTTPSGDGRMVWHRWRPPGAAADGAAGTLVLLHGGYGSWTHWLRNIPALSARYTVLAPDLPGLGDSDPAPGPYDGWSLARILADGLARLVPPPGRYHLAGFSFGGVLSGPLATLEGERVRSLTLVGSGGLGLIRRPIEMTAWRTLATAEERAAAHRHNLATLMLADPARIDALAIHLQGENARRGRTKSRPISLSTILSDALPRIAAPLNGIWGERDATAWPHLAEREALLRLSHPELAFHVVPGAGHWVQYEAPDAFDAALLALLARRETEKGATGRAPRAAKA